MKNKQLKKSFFKENQKIALLEDKEILIKLTILNYSKFFYKSLKV
jgi:hypothetical protein